MKTKMHLHLCQTGFLQIQDFFQSFSKTIIFFSEKPLWETIIEKNIFNFQESIVFEKIRKNEDSCFYLINYAKIRVKMIDFIAIASVPKQDSKL